MKVEVSIPDGVFRAAERASRRLRIPRSRFYTRAVEAYVKQHSGQEITERLNRVCARVASDFDPFVEAASLEILRRQRW